MLRCRITNFLFSSSSSSSSGGGSTQTTNIISNPFILRNGDKNVILKASSFTNNPVFYETINLLKDIKSRIGDECPKNKKNIIQWFPKDVMSERLGTTLSPIQYRKIIAELNLISHSPKIRDFLKSFSSSNIDNILGGDDDDCAADVKLGADGSPDNSKTKATSTNTSSRIVKMRNFIKKKMQVTTMKLPNLGKLTTLPDGTLRSRSEGGRKDARAVVHLQPCKDKERPNIVINGMDAHDIWGFGNLQEMFMISEPFSLTGTECMFDVEGVVTGGGKKGKAGAIANGIARSLALFGKGYCINFILFYHLHY